MRNRNPRATEFNAGRAIQIRGERALRQAGGLEAVLAPVVAAIVELHGAKLGELGTSYLKESGGWSAIIFAAIGPAPEGQPNAEGFETNPEFFLWQIKQARRWEIRNRVIDAIREAI